MRFLANENFPMPSIRLLQKAGHEVVGITESSPGISDKKVLDTAKAQDLIILTFDSDYGELIFRHEVKNPPAVIYFRYKGKDPEFAGEQLSMLIEQESLNFERHFTVIEQNNVRQRKYG